MSGPASRLRVAGDRGAVPVRPLSSRRGSACAPAGRAPVVELVGPWGAGKGTLLAAIGAADAEVRTGLDIWHLPRLLLARNAIAALPPVAALWAGAHRPSWAEAKHIAKLGAMHAQLGMRRHQSPRALVIDEGPVFTLTTMLREKHPATRDRGGWWERTVRTWADRVDLVVLLDAPNALLARRIRERPRYHPLQQSPTAEIFAELDSYREASRSVTDQLGAHGRLQVLHFETDQLTAAAMACTVLTAVARQRRGR